MNIEAYKNQIIKKLIAVQDEKILEQIESVLNGNSTVANTFEGKSLTKSQYIEHIENISQSVADGAETYTSEQVRNHVLSQKE
jgi:seryl-tRNA(Sec) selenium transferase